MGMSVPVIMQFAALAVTVIIGVCVVWLIFEMRGAYNDQQDKFLRAISAVEEFQTLQSEFVSFLRRVESDGHALQKIAIQVEGAVAALKENVNSSIAGAAERQVATIESLRDHLDAQEEQLNKLLESLLAGIQSLPQALPGAREVQREIADQSRLRRQSLSQDPELRFSVLREWLSVNALAILHRASKGWNSSRDLIAYIPPYLEAEADILNDSILVIGTREHTEKLALPLRELESTSDFKQWFDPASDGQGPSHIPAVLMRSNGHYKLVSKGSHSANGNGG
jgi:hypothetical protein